MATLERAIEIAIAAHRGQRDKAGRPYILHPLWVMHQFEDPDTMIVAVLHDVVEDSAYTLQALSEEGFSPGIVEAVEAMTHREGESYDAYIQRVQAHPVARNVKLADLKHNMNLVRMAQLQPPDMERLQKYHRAWSTLKGG